MPLRLDNPFWRFSLRVYAEPGVSQECLALQEASAIDVNLLLFCAWLGAERGVSLTADDISAAETVVGTWHTAVVRRLREVRRQIKSLAHADGTVADFRKSVAAVEIGAEQIEQAMLWEWAEARWSKRAAVADETLVGANLDILLHRHAGHPSRPERLVRAAVSRRLDPSGE